MPEFGDRVNRPKKQRSLKVSLFGAAASDGRVTPRRTLLLRPVELKEPRFLFVSKSRHTRNKGEHEVRALHSVPISYSIPRRGEPCVRPSSLCSPFLILFALLPNRSIKPHGNARLSPKKAGRSCCQRRLLSSRAAACRSRRAGCPRRTRSSRRTGSARWSGGTGSAGGSGSARRTGRSGSARSARHNHSCVARRGGNHSRRRCGVIFRSAAGGSDDA